MDLTEAKVREYLNRERNYQRRAGKLELVFPPSVTKIGLCETCLAAMAEVERLSKALAEMRSEVYWFAQEMEAQLKANDHKGEDGWVDEDLEFLYAEARNHLSTLKPFLDPGDADCQIVHEAADVANFMMMLAEIHHRSGCGCGRRGRAGMDCQNPTVVGTGDFADDDKVVTMHYEDCGKCPPCLGRAKREEEKADEEMPCQTPIRYYTTDLVADRRCGKCGPCKAMKRERAKREEEEK